MNDVTKKTTTELKAEQLTDRLYAAAKRSGFGNEVSRMGIYVTSTNDTFVVEYDEESTADGLIPNGYSVLARAETWLVAATSK